MDLGPDPAPFAVDRSFAVGFRGLLELAGKWAFSPTENLDFLVQSCKNFDLKMVPRCLMGVVVLVRQSPTPSWTTSPRMHHSAATLSHP